MKPARDVTMPMPDHENTDDWEDPDMTTNPELEAHLHGQGDTKAMPVGVSDGDYAWGLLLNTARGICEKLESETASVTLLDQMALREAVDRAARLSTIEAGPGEPMRLREIISECATALGNGAAIAPSCSIEFMAKLPEEIRLAVSRLSPIGGEAEPVALTAVEKLAVSMTDEKIADALDSECETILQLVIHDQAHQVAEHVGALKSWSGMLRGRASRMPKIAAAPQGGVE